MSRRSWALAGIAAGAMGLATSYLVATVMAVTSPVVAVGDTVIDLTPGPVVKAAIDLFGMADKAVLLSGVLILLVLASAGIGVLARRSLNLAFGATGLLSALGLGAVVTQAGSSLAILPVFVGFSAWLVALSVLSGRLSESGGREAGEQGSVAASDVSGDGAARVGRRGFMQALGLSGVAAAAVAGAAWWIGRSRAGLQNTVRLLKLDQVSKPAVPPATSVGLEGITPWMTPNEDFYLIHTALFPPTVSPDEWRLRIHGLVDQPLEFGYSDLVARQMTEAWITINCVSNQIGGDLIGNAWWSGVRLADLLAEAGVRDGADAILQTSKDGWTCGTPLAALTDDRDAMLAVAMNGKPLPIEHGFPVRTLVPGLYGFVSACKWVVDLEVTRFDDISAYWTERGWSERAPVKISSRIDVPRSGGSVAAGAARVGGLAWAQHTGIREVQVSLDGGPWQVAERLGEVPTVDTWVQWETGIQVGQGDHELRVRAVGRDGEVQTGVVADVLPDGATGWHTVSFTAS